MRKMSLMIVVAIVAVACSPASEAGSAQTAAADVASTTTVPAPTTTATPSTTTTQAPLTGAACVAGSWELDSESFFAEVTTAMSDQEAPREFRYVGGAYRIVLGDDESASEQRDDWTFLVRTDFGDLVIMVNSTAEGAYAVDGDALSLDLEQSSDEVEVLIDGLPIDMPGGGAPVAIPDASFDGAPFTCSQDTLVTTIDGITSTWRRSI